MKKLFQWLTSIKKIWFLWITANKQKEKKFDKSIKVLSVLARSTIEKLAAAVENSSPWFTVNSGAWRWWRCNSSQDKQGWLTSQESSPAQRRWWVEVILTEDVEPRKQYEPERQNLSWADVYIAGLLNRQKSAIQNLSLVGPQAYMGVAISQAPNTARHI